MKRKEDLLKEFNKTVHIYNHTKSTRIKKKQEAKMKKFVALVGRAFKQISNFLAHLWDVIKSAVNKVQEGVANV